MNSAIFRQFSIRGNAARDLPDDVVAQIATGFSTYFEQNVCDGRKPTLVIGRDVRRSSPRISHALQAGLRRAGSLVLDVGLVPTPVLNFAVDHFAADGGVMVTASHNPPPDNGFKLRAAETLMGETLQTIYRMTGDPSPSNEGTLTQVDAVTPYFNALQSRVIPGRALKIVIDGGNGANGPLMANFLRAQGHTVIEQFIEPDGNFPNRNPDPTAENALAATGDVIRRHQADVGIAFDGDGDRVALLDEQGQPHYGDVILMLLARDVALRGGDLRVVHDVSSTQGLADDVQALGGESYPAPVGYAFVHHKMMEIGATLGGESAGHIFCIDDLFNFDDALLATVKLLNYFTAQNRPVSALVADLPRYHTSPNYRLSCPDNLKGQVVAALVAHFQKSHPVDTTDGAKIFFPKGWALIRQSNTQPALSFRVEGQTAADLSRIKTDTQATISRTLETFGVSPTT